MNFGARTPRTLACGVSVLSALLAHAAFPPLDQPWIAWIAWTPWIVWHASAPRRGTMFWLTFALYLNVVLSMGWVASLEVWGPWFIPLITVPMACAGAWMLQRLTRTPGSARWWMYPLVFVSIDVLREFVLGIAWNTSGHSQWRWIAGLQSAAVFRSHALSFSVLAVNSALAFLWIAWRRSEARGGIPRGALTGVAWAAGLVLLLHGAGTLAVRDDFAVGPHMVGVQPAVPQAQKLRHTEASVWDRNRVALAEAGTKVAEADILVFPETTFPPIRDPDRSLARMLEAPSRREGASLETYGGLLPRGRGQLSIVGYARHARIADDPRLDDADGNGWGEWNMAAVLRDGHTLLGENPKRILVPFGEYVPWPRGWWFHDAILAGVRGSAGYIPDMTAGSEAPLFAVREGMGEPRFGCTICFEVVFPEEFRRLAAQGASFCVNLSNDAWFTIGAEQELVDIAVRFRAAECRRAVFRVSNAGISTLIDPCGRALACVTRDGKAKDVAGVLEGDVPLCQDTTPAVKLGLLPAGIFPLALLAALALLRCRCAAKAESA